VFGVFSAVLALAGAASSLRYEAALPLCKDERTSLSLLAVVGFLLLAFAGVTAVLLLFLDRAAGAWLQGLSIYSVLWLLPVAILIFGMYQALGLWLGRSQRFRLLSASRILSSGTQAIFQVMGGLLQLGATGLVAGVILGRLSGSIIGFARSLTGARLPAWRDLMGTAKQYKKFPVYYLWASLVHAVGLQLPIILFASSFSAELTGFYALTMRVLGLPVLLLGEAVSRVFYPTAVERLKHPEKLRSLVLNVLTTLLYVAVPVFLAVFFWAPEAFSFVFGETWRDAGRFVQVLTIWFFLQFISSPLSTLVLVKGRQRTQLIFSICDAAFRIGMLWLGILTGSAYWALGALAGAGAISMAIYTGWMLRLVSLSYTDWLFNQVGYFVQGLIVLGLVVALQVLLAPLPAMLGGMTILGIFGAVSFTRLRFRADVG